jgi:hypothetical protein
MVIAVHGHKGCCHWRVVTIHDHPAIIGCAKASVGSLCNTARQQNRVNNRGLNGLFMSGMISLVGR